MSEQRTKRQHYVPQFYLSEFGRNSDDPRVHVRRRGVAPYGPVHVREVAFENYFHDLPEDPRQDVETRLSKLEGGFAESHRRILQTEDLTNLSQSETETYSSFIALQQRRTKRAREELKLLLRGFVDGTTGWSSPDLVRKLGTRALGEGVGQAQAMLSNALRTPIGADQAASLVSRGNEAIADTVANYGRALSKGRLPDEVRSLIEEELNNEEDIKRRHVGSLSRMTLQIAATIREMSWILFVNRTGTPFLTSDNPIAMINARAMGSTGDLGGPGFALVETALHLLGYVPWVDASGGPNPELAVHFPLSPKLLLRLDGKYTGRRRGVRRLEVQRDDLVAFFNRLQAAQCHEAVFCRDGEFEPITPMLEVSRIARDVADQILDALRSWLESQSAP